MLDSVYASTACASTSESCPHCAGHFQAILEPGFAFVSVSFGCRSRFLSILGRQFSDFRFALAQPLFTDAYYLHHSVGSDPRTGRSAMVHLAALFAQIELGWTGERVVLLRKRLSQSGPCLVNEPRLSAGLSIAEISLDSAEAHWSTVQTYAAGIFAAWSDYHGLAARLCAEPETLAGDGDAASATNTNMES